MSEWVDKTESILTALSIPYDFERFSTDPDNPQLPDTYIVYFLVDDVGSAYSDGKETAHQPRVQVSLYFRDKTEFLTIPDQIKAAFMSSGFTRGSEGTIPFQPDTGHYGWRQDFYSYERR